MFKKIFISTAILLLIVTLSESKAQIPIPARIGGTFYAGSTQITNETDQGYEIVVKKEDGSDFDPPAQDKDGLNANHWYTLDIPIYEATHRPLGANPGETVVIHVYMNGGEQAVEEPLNGRLQVGQSGSNTQVNIRIGSNEPPVARAGSTINAAQGETVTLDGSGSSDPDDGIESFLWTQKGGTVVSLSNSGIAKAQFTAPDVGAEAETLIFELKVTDGGGLWDTDEVSVVIAPGGNRPPVARAGVDQTVREGDAVTLDGTDSGDPDDGIATYLWIQIDGAQMSLTDADKARATFTAKNGDLDGEALIFRLTVTDNSGEKDSDEVIVNIATSANEPPVASAGPDRTVSPGETVSLDGSGSSDPDDGIAAFLWEQIKGAVVNLAGAGEPHPSFTAPEEGGPLEFQLTVTDNGGLKSTDTVVINLSAGENKPPVARAGTDMEVNYGDKVTLDGAGSHDPDDGIKSYLWSQTGGKAVELSDVSAVKPYFTAPEAGDGGLSLTFQLEVRDFSGLSHTDSVVVTVAPPDNSPPKARAGDDQTVYWGNEAVLDGSGSSDPDNDDISYEWTQTQGTPTALSDSSVPGPSLGTTGVKKEGETLEYELKVTDSKGLFDTDSVLINVVTGNLPPAADAGDSQEISEGATVFLDGSASSDPDDGIASYEWTQSNGSAVSLSNPNMESPNFVTPPVGPEGEELVFRLLVRDFAGLESSANVRITVSDNGIDIYPSNILSFYSATKKELGIRVTKGSLIRLNPISDGAISDSKDRPIHFIYGLIDFDVKVDAPGKSAVVEIFLSEQAPHGYAWFQHDSFRGWWDLGGHIHFNSARTIIQITIPDGGEADSDRSVNGVIKGLSGLGLLQAVAPEPSGEGAGDTSGGCFITGSAPHNDLLNPRD